MAVKLGNGQWAVKENNLLAYNDNSGQFFNKEFDFTRGSSATYVGKDGLIKTAGLQDTNLVQNGDFSQLGSELVTNGDFSNGNTGWNLGTNFSVADGKLKSINTANAALTLQSAFVFTIGKRYKLTFDISDYVEGSVRIWFGGFNAGNFNSNGTFSVIGVANRVDEILIQSIGSNNTYSIDNVSVKQLDPNDEWSLGSGWSYGDGVVSCDGSDGVNLNQNGVIENGKTYKISFEVLNYVGGFLNGRIGSANSNDFTVNSNGSYSFNVLSDGTNLIFRSSSFNGSVSNISVQEIQVNTPRIDFSDSADGALLLEPQSTNLIQYSEDFSDSYWNKGSNTTVINNYAISPQGKQNATRIQMPDTSGTFLDIYLSSLQGNTLTVSFYAKNNGGTTNINTFLLGNNSQTISLTDKWVRYDFTGIADSNLRVGIDNINGGGDVDFLLYGFQLEQQSFSTSYIPTQGSSSTRIAETCNNSGSAQDFNSEEGVFYVEIAALADSLNYRFISISDGTNNNRIYLNYSNASNQIQASILVGGVQSYGVTHNLSSIIAYNKIALKWKLNDFSLYVNGVEVSTNNSNITFPANTLNKINFSNELANLFDFEGKVKSVEVFTTALSDEELQKLTTI